MTTTGKPLHVQLTPGHRHEATVARDLLEYAIGNDFIADAGYDSNSMIDAVLEVGMRPVICQNRSRTEPAIELDPEAYAQRYLVEVFFHHLKRFRAIATRYEKTARNFLALVHLACVMITLAPN